jgi:predicted ATP-grasp superfamily ATP-dependent carboligase
LGTVADKLAQQTILVTGGRAPAALELVRLLHRAGYRVVMAESLRGHLSRPSRAISKNYCVPWPSTQTAAYLAELSKIIGQERVDLILPTCEEIYFMIENRLQLPETCHILAPNWELLHAMHSKWEFIGRASKWDLPVPETELLLCRQRLEDVFSSGRKLVYKPVYSRFACQALVGPTKLEELSKVQPTPDMPWVAQEFIAGKQISTYSLAYQGRLLAHATYPMNFTTGIGPTFAYESMEQPAALSWVSKLVEAEAFTGQIAFDFIERNDGSVVAIECNPRSTSGLHLFRGRIDLAHALVHPEKHDGPLLVPQSRRPAHHALPLFLWALGYVRSWKELKRWARTFFWGKDVLLDATDPMPLLLLGYNLIPLYARARKHGVNIDQATTIDIEWNGAIHTGQLCDPVGQRICHNSTPSA